MTTTNKAADRTANAHRAGHLALILETAVKRTFGAYSVVVSRPDFDLTTGNGTRALQHISLVAADGASLVIGWAHVGEGKAELNTLGHTLARSKKRYGREIVLPPLEYLRFIETATKVLEELGLSVKVVAWVKSDLESVMRAKMRSSDDAAESGVRRLRTLPFYGAAVGALSAASAFTYLLVHP